MKLSAKSADGVRPLGSAAGRRALGEMAEDGSPETEEERLYRLYKEQAEGVGPDLMKTLLDSLALRGEALGKLEIELQWIDERSRGRWRSTMMRRSVR